MSSGIERPLIMKYAGWYGSVATSRLHPGAPAVQPTQRRDLRQCLAVNVGIHLGELEQVFPVVAALGVVVGGRRQPEIGFTAKLRLPPSGSCVASPGGAGRGMLVGSTMIAPYSPISTCRSPWVPL